jgi:hypothetical protein
MNGPASFAWMLHDIDKSGAWSAHEEADLPMPTFVAINPENGHAHSGYLLTTPVARHNAARIKPLRYFADIERGIGRRLGADRRYTGLIAKNPWHPAWRTDWRRPVPYDLDELNDSLTASDKRPDPTIQETLGAGRNCTVFDDLRHVAYREVVAFKRSGTFDGWRQRLENVALGINLQFACPLGFAEVRGIAKSVAKWTWRHFDVPTFVAIQAKRGAKRAVKLNADRWTGHLTPEATGLTRRQAERRARYRTRLALSAPTPNTGLLP